MKAHTIHAVRFYKPKPKAGHTLAYSPERKLLAVSRENGTIEIFNFQNGNSPLLQFSIPAQGLELDRSIEALAFTPDGRLFSVGLHGFVYQHFVCQKIVDKPNIPEFWPVTSGAAWCMKYNKKRNKLAIGTEEGFICLFDVVPDGLNFDKILDKQEGRVLSLDWHVDGNHIITGSVDTLRLWDVESGHPLQRMSTGRIERNLETTVWSVLMLDDFTVVSGDSRGKVSFWKSKNGTLIDSFQSHKADVLTIGCNEEQNTIYASGVDPTIVHFQSVVKHESKVKWMKSIQRYVNTHDVHALTVLPKVDSGRIISIGVDANLFVDNPRKKSSLHAAHPFVWGDYVVSAPDVNMICLMHENSIELWRLGKSGPPKNENISNNFDNGVVKKPIEVLKVTQDPVKVLEVKCSETETIHNMAVSTNGEYLVYATKSKLKLLRLDVDMPKIQKVAIQVEKVPHLMKFGSNGKHLFTADNYGHVQVFSLGGDSATLQNELKVNSGISHMVVDDTNFCIIADYANNITVYDIDQGKIQCKITKYDEAPISCMALQPKSKTLIVVYSNHHFVECCTKTGKYTKLTNILQDNFELIPKEWRYKAKPTKGILFPQSHLSGMLSKKSDTIMFYDEDFIAVLDRNAVANYSSQPTSSKQAKKTGGNEIKKHDIDTSKSGALRLAKRYEHLVFLGTLRPESNEDLTCPLVAVEVKPQTLENQLPPAIRRKKFGAM